VPLTFEQTRQLFNAGRYLEIVSHGNYPERELATMHAEQRVLLAHAMFQAGQIGRARQIVERERERATGIVRSRYELLLGMLHRHDAQLAKALQHYNTAFQIAHEHGEDLDVAWASLYRFRLLAQLHGSDELAPMLAEVRRHVARAGDPHATVHMHDAVALMEASSGRIEEARRHLEISTSLIQRFPNSGLEQVVLISSSFVDFFESKFQSAVDHLNAARRLATATGARDTGVLECNLGHAMLVLGRLQPAETYFRHVLEHGSILSRFSALEGLARLYLSAGQLSRCEVTLEEHETFLLRDKSLALAFSGRWAAATHVRLLIKQGKYDDAAALARGSLESLGKLSDRILVSELTCLLAEALVGAGNTKDGALQLLHLVTRDPVQAGNADAMYYRALGFLVNRSHPALGYELFRRARNVYVHQGNKLGEADVQNLIERAAPHVDIGELPILVLQAVASALGNGDSPTLLGQELMHVAKLTGCSPRAELGVFKEADNAHAADRHVTLKLGTVDGRQQAVRFQIPTRPHETAGLADLMRIGASVVALNDFRRERRQRAAIWPIDQPETTVGALFLAEEMQTLLSTARRVAATNVPVLITGETGTGKEVLARAIHAHSNRAKAAFVPFNCTSTPRDMVDSQLFGHRRGSFTGAIENFQGIIRGAASGTLFLDEIGDMSLDVQPKLLRFLESGEVHPVGETQPVRADVRVIAATNVNLDALVSDGRFREDLFYRLNIVHLPIPPLRERRVEIPALANHYLAMYAQEYARGRLRLAEETMEYLALYRWPGNVRQLANEMRRVAALCEPGAVVMPEHLSSTIAASRRTIPASERVLDATEVVVRLDQPLAAATEHLERAMLQYALKECDGRMEETAARLGLSRKGLYLKRQRLGIEPPASAGVGV
jgi:DNA-binding NtrC family response regulator/tetratricopeptide (TPR) repeat protein